MPRTNKANAKAATVAKPAIVATPVQPTAAEISKRDADKARCEANKRIVQPHYDGPSLTTHRSVPPKLAEALSRVANPIQRAKSATPRDESALALAASHADADGTFCPVAATADLGALSRLASLGHLAVSGNRIALTKSGRDLAAIVAKRKA